MSEKEFPFFTAVGKFASRYRYPIIALWLVVLAVVFAFAPSLEKVSTSDTSGIVPHDAPSIVALEKAQEYFPEQTAPSQVVVVIDNNGNSFDNPEYKDYLDDLTVWLQTNLDDELVNQVLSPSDPAMAESLISPDGQVAMLYVGFLTAPEDPRATETLEAIRMRLEDLPDGYSGYATGSAGIINDYTTQALSSIDSATLITIILVISMLLLIYRSPVTPLVPLATIGVSYLISRGIVAWLTNFGLTVVSFTQAFLVVILFGIGTDYCLFIVSRFREFITDDASPQQASSTAITRVGETITSSAGTVMVGMIAMGFARMKLFSNTGPTMVIGIIITLLAGLTFTPALLAILGKKAFWLVRIDKKNQTSKLWTSIAHFVTERNWLPLAFALIVLVPLAIFGVGLRQTFDMTADLPETIQSKKGFMTITDHFGAGDMQPLDLVMTNSTDATSPDGLAETGKLTQALLTTDGVADVRSLTLPAGKSQSSMGDFFLVKKQLSMMANTFSSFLEPNETSTANSLFAEMNSFDLDDLSTYLDDLEQTFPKTPDQELESAKASLLKLTQDLEASSLPVFLKRQLLSMTYMIESLGSQTNTSDITAESMAQFAELHTYFGELATAFPELAQTTEFETLDALLARIDLLSNAQSLLGKPKESTQDEAAMIESILAELVTDIKAVADRAGTLYPHAIFIPSSDLAADQMSTLGEQFAQVLEPFQSSLQALSDAFPDEQAYFLPQALLSGSLQTSFQSLIDMYTNQEDKATRLQIVLADEPYSHAAIATSQNLIDTYKSENGYFLSGTTPSVVDIQDMLDLDTTRTIALVLIGIAIVLVLLLRSLVAPIYLLATILLSYLSTLGICRIVFEVLFHTEITWYVPFFVFVLLVALGMDYNIFLMGRVKEETSKHGTKLGVEYALAHTGNIITSAGIILAGTFAALMSSSIIGLIEIGFAVTVGVLLDTFVIRTLLVPAIAIILDKWNWWPGSEPGKFKKG